MLMALVGWLAGWRFCIEVGPEVIGNEFWWRGSTKHERYWLGRGRAGWGRFWGSRCEPGQDRYLQILQLLAWNHAVIGGIRPKKTEKISPGGVDTRSLLPYLGAPTEVGRGARETGGSGGLDRKPQTP